MSILIAKEESHDGSGGREGRSAGDDAGVMIGDSDDCEGVDFDGFVACCCCGCYGGSGGIGG